MPIPEPPGWNLNLASHQIILEAVPAGARSAIDLGCGDGWLSADLARRGLGVTAIDLDRASLERARQNLAGFDAVSIHHGDLLAPVWPAAAFDVVASVATLHHVEPEAGLVAMRRLVAPGGVLAIVSFARRSGPGDVARDAVGAARTGLARLRGRYWEHDAPVCWPPPATMAEMRTLASGELPGVRFVPLLSGRYGLVWRAPAA